MEEIFEENRKPYDWKHFDYHGCRFDYSGWESYFCDYQEISREMNTAEKLRQGKLKMQIMSGVPMEYRASA